MQLARLIISSRAIVHLRRILISSGLVALITTASRGSSNSARGMIGGRRDTWGRLRSRASCVICGLRVSGSGELDQNSTSRQGDPGFLQSLSHQHLDGSGVGDPRIGVGRRRNRDGEVRSPENLPWCSPDCEPPPVGNDGGRNEDLAVSGAQFRCAEPTRNQSSSEVPTHSHQPKQITDWNRTS